jgi:hypothetical protein
MEGPIQQQMALAIVREKESPLMMMATSTTPYFLNISSRCVNFADSKRLCFELVSVQSGMSLGPHQISGGPHGDQPGTKCPANHRWPMTCCSLSLSVKVIARLSFNLLSCRHIHISTSLEFVDCRDSDRFSNVALPKTDYIYIIKIPHPYLQFSGLRTIYTNRSSANKTTPIQPRKHAPYSNTPVARNPIYRR